MTMKSTETILLSFLQQPMLLITHKQLLLRFWKSDEIFDDDNLQRCSISANSQTDNSGSENTSDDDNQDIKVNGYNDAESEVDPEIDCYQDRGRYCDLDRRLSGKLSESSGSAASDLYDYKPRKIPSTESIDSSGEKELAIQRLEIAKNDFRQRIAKEARGNAILQASLERRKHALHEHRVAIEQDVTRLQEQLQAERDLRAALEVGLSMSSGQFPSLRGMESKRQMWLD